MINIKRLIEKVFYERIKDDSQIRYAEGLYNIIYTNNKKSKRLEGKNVYDFTDIVGFEFVIAIINNRGNGHGFGKVTMPSGRKYNAILIDNSKKDYKSKNPKTLPQLLEVFKSIFIHEIIHILDNRRDKTGSSSLPTDDNYYNHPKEFNAYYLQFAQECYDIFKNKVDLHSNNKDRWINFYSEFGNNEIEFSEKYWKMVSDYNDELKKSLNKDYLFKWNKRIYQLYSELKDKVEIKDI